MRDALGQFDHSDSDASCVTRCLISWIPSLGGGPGAPRTGKYMLCASQDLARARSSRATRRRCGSDELLQLRRLAVLGWLFLLAPLWISAAELTPADGGMPFRLGWRDIKILADPSDQGLRLPELVSRNPLHLTIEFGSGPDQGVSGVIDESRGTGTGYDTVRLDSNNNNDLTDDPALKPAIVHEGPVTALELDAVTLAIRYAGGNARNLRVKLELRSTPRAGTKDRDWSAGCHLDQHMEGRLKLGEGQSVAIAVFDSARGAKPSNGCFNDWGVDRINVDLNGDGVLDPKSEEAPLSSVLLVKGELWALEIDDAGRTVAANPFQGDTGFVAFDFVATGAAGRAVGQIDVMGDAGLVFAVPVGGDAPVRIPAAKYRMPGGEISAKTGDGREWVALFSSDQTIDVGKGTTNRVKLGGPFSLGIDAQGTLQRGKDVCIEPVIRGVAGEVYENVAPAGSRMTPDTKVIGPEDIVLTQGPMDYG